jgi:hypothetical protein
MSRREVCSLLYKIGIASGYRRSNHGAKQMHLTRGGRGHEALAAVEDQSLREARETGLP